MSIRLCKLPGGKHGVYTSLWEWDCLALTGQKKIGFGYRNEGHRMRFTLK